MDNNPSVSGEDEGNAMGSGSDDVELHKSWGRKPEQGVRGKSPGGRHKQGKIDAPVEVLMKESPNFLALPAIETLGRAV